MLPLSTRFTTGQTQELDELLELLLEDDELLREDDELLDEELLLEDVRLLDDVELALDNELLLDRLLEEEVSLDPLDIELLETLLRLDELLTDGHELLLDELLLDELILACSPQNRRMASAVNNRVYSAPVIDGGVVEMAVGSTASTPIAPVC